MAVSRINEAGLNVNQYGNRNLVINGAMQVAQRATSATGVGDTNGVYPTLDRYRYILGDASAGRFTMTQEADGPVGFANSLKMACTTADTSIAAGERMFLQHKIEAQNCQAIGKGETGAKPITVSFYVKANAAKTYGLEVFESNSSRQCTKLFNVTTDWTRVVLTFPADVDDGSSPIPDTTAEGLVLQWQLHAGSNYTSGTLNSSAFADNVNANRAVGIDSFYSSTSNTFFITGIQLEVGDTATDFEHRTFGDELSRCQRYCQRLPSNDQADGDAYSSITHGFSDSTTTASCFLTLPTTMRVEPTITVSGNWRVIHENTATAISSGPVLTDAYSNVSTAAIVGTVGSAALTAGNGCAITQNNDADANIILDAEL